ncbi:hypothetical protein BOO69_17765 [Sulfitobacter alexandrii]|uniref:HAD-IIIC family phosphatase n=1 Tax=Sulfitobacter alexandrii TaxID=1917485 RepID=A0A1J0WL39_9RHOB|nr:hypothetical protein [Sulfitobacter alexandrii]APE45052.1 hypothetical protein BOO69_17765 [Sulfitobacter alexandrii]
MKTPEFAENIRLIIWDLDETFWDGTLTEGGISYRDDHHQLVIDLAKRGIMSAICSKNDHEPIEELLREKGLWDYFIFPSIDWTPKGPRIKAMLETIGLRAASTLFLDDNPMNLAQAEHANPGLNCALPDVIAGLRDAPQLKGKDDSQLSRLAQYKVTEKKAEAAKVTGGDTTAFLRQSNVKVFIEYDVEAHLDRAVELVNRTNQLNFTKNRLSDDPETARRELSQRLAHNTTDAALIRVRDDFGDYGFVGFYMTRRVNNTRTLEHFCFSCRTLNMYIEHWVYAFLGRPKLSVVGEVLSDVQDTAIEVDWITPANIEDMDAPSPGADLTFDHIFARGGCDLASLLHYFTLHSGTIVEEFNEPRNGQMFRRDHSSFLMPELEGGLTPAQTEAASALGYAPRDFDTDILNMGPGQGLYFLSFWADADIPVYRHRETGLRVPYWLVGAQNHNLVERADLRKAIAKTDQQRERLNVLCEEYEHEGILSQDEMERRYNLILDRLPPTAQVVMILAAERGPLHFADPSKPPHPFHQRLNATLNAVAKGRSNVMLLDPASLIDGTEDMIDLNHFKRDVYHRMYRAMLSRFTNAKAA